jgi:hypothetical protein
MLCELPALAMSRPEALLVAVLQVIHRDLKLENILLSSAGPEGKGTAKREGQDAKLAVGGGRTQGGNGK